MLTENHLKQLNAYLSKDADAAEHIGAYLKKADELAQAKTQFRRMMDHLFRMEGLAKEIRGTSPAQMVQTLRGDDEMSDTADFAVASWTGNIWASIDRLSKALEEAGYARTTSLASFSKEESEQKSWSRPTGA